MEDLVEAKHKKLIINLADLPKGLTVEEWLYYLEALDIEVNDNK